MAQSSETPGTPARRLLRTLNEQSKQRLLFVALLVVALASIALLILGDKPWEIRIDERLVAGKRIKLDLFIAEGIWLAAAFNLLCAAVLFVTRGIWSGPLPGIFQKPPAVQQGPGIKWWFAAGLGLAMLIAGIERWPKLDQGFGNDEEYAFRRLIHGEHTLADDGHLTFEPRTWSETLFGNSASNNHVFFTALSRLSHDFFETLCGTEPHAVIERAARLPSFVAGLLSIPLLGLLLAQVGMPGAGLIAGWLLAFNPWHLRYATEARGYSVMIFCLLLATLCLVTALQTGRRSAWLGYGISQAASLLAFPGALYVAISLNLIGLVLIVRSPLRWRTLRHWTAANIGSAMLFAQIFAPSVRQLMLFLDERAASAAMGMEWWRDLWSHLAAGMRWAMDDASNPALLSIQHSFSQHNYAEFLLLVLLPAFFAIGIIRSLVRSGTAWLVSLPTLAAVALAYGHISHSGQFLYSWYVFYGIIGFVAATGMGLDLLLNPASRNIPFHPLVRAAGGCAVLLFLGAYSVVTAYPRGFMVSTDRQPIRAAVDAAHEGHGKSDSHEPQRLITAAIGTSAKQKFTYAPRIVPLALTDEKALPKLEELERSAVADNIPLRVLICNPDMVRERAPITHARISQSDNYQVLTEISGLEAMFRYLIVEYRHASQKSE